MNSFRAEIKSQQSKLVCRFKYTFSLVWQIQTLIICFVLFAYKRRTKPNLVIKIEIFGMSIYVWVYFWAIYPV